MCNVVQLCLATNIFCSCVNETSLFSFLRSLLHEKWQIASIPEDIHYKKQTWCSNDKKIIFYLVFLENE